VERLEEQLELAPGTSAALSQKYEPQPFPKAGQ